MKSNYPLSSEILVDTAIKFDQTTFNKLYFSPPYKLMRPFQWRNGKKILLMSSAPGLLDKDYHKLTFNVNDYTSLWVTTQSYEKIFTTPQHGSKRETYINVGKGAYLKYLPLPTIPYANSNHESKTIIRLHDETSQLAFSEIITAGRIFKLDGERFSFQKFSSLTEIKVGDNIIFIDNTKLIPEKNDMNSFGFFEGFTHLGNLVIVNFKNAVSSIKYVRNLIKNNNQLIGGVSTTESNDINIRVLGYRGQDIVELFNKITSYIEDNNLNDERM